MKKLTLELNEKFSKANTTFKLPGGTTGMITPPLDEDYWALRVKLSDKQAIVAFPKFTTMGVGFQVEEDWNTNLPYSCEAVKIYEHIRHNKGDRNIRREDCIRAIQMIKDALQNYKKN